MIRASAITNPKAADIADEIRFARLVLSNLSRDLSATEFLARVGFPVQGQIKNLREDIELWREFVAELEREQGEENCCGK